MGGVEAGEVCDHAGQAGQAGQVNSSIPTIQASSLGDNMLPMNLPARVAIHELGPREGFQYEPVIVPTASKIELIDALSRTGLTRLQVTSFVNARLVPGLADAIDVVNGMERRPGVLYDALWLNESGFRRAHASGRLDLEGYVITSASEEFVWRNQRQRRDSLLEQQRKMIRSYQEAGVPVLTVGVIAAFGCNYEGEVAAASVIGAIESGIRAAQEAGYRIETISLADTMGWATPLDVINLVSAVRERWPTEVVELHLHDTRGMGLANAWAGLTLGVARFDSSIGGLGGCPFSGFHGAAGNLCTEDFVLMCEEAGIETGVDLDALLETARLAERLVGRQLPGRIMRAGRPAIRHAPEAAPA